jgi:hypothetical protein
MTGFDAVVRVARLALQSSAEGVETLHRYVARAASAYRIDVDVMVLPEQILLKEQGSGPVERLVVVRETPGIFRLDQLAALKRILCTLRTAWIQMPHAANLMQSRRRRLVGQDGSVSWASPCLPLVSLPASLRHGAR